MLKTFASIIVAAQLLGPGDILWQKTQTFVGAGCVLTKAGGSCKLFPAGINISTGVTGISRSASTFCAFSGDDTSTIDANREIATLPAIGLALPAVGSKDSFIPQFETMIDGGTGGAVAGICSDPISSGLNKGMYEPCAVNGDCSVGTCNTTRNTWSLTQRQQVGLYLVCIADSDITVRIEKIYEAK